MNPDDDPARQKAWEWLDYVEEDRRMAEHVLRTLDRPPYRLVAYHAQQCAEKHFQAYLVLRRIDFPRTHNISLLLELIEPFGKWVDDLAEAELLSTYAVAARYPGDNEPIGAAETEEALRLARAVRDRVRRALKDEGLIG